MIELYHNALSTCSQKVRLVMAEKELDFTSHEVNLVAGEQHAPDYAKLNPNHVVPTLVHDGMVLIESTLINEYLDEAFPEVALRPADPVGRHALRMWTKKIDEKVHPAAGIITYAIGARAAMLNQPEEVRRASVDAIPDPARRAARQSVLDHGVKAPEFAGALSRFVELLDSLEEHLASHPWASGDAFGLADAAALPYVLRLDHLAMAPLLSPDARPRTADWYERMKSRPSFVSGVALWAPEPLIAMFRNNGAAVWADVEPLTRPS